MITLTSKLINEHFIVLVIIVFKLVQYLYYKFKNKLIYMM